MNKKDKKVIKEFEDAKKIVEDSKEYAQFYWKDITKNFLPPAINSIMCLLVARYIESLDIEQLKKFSNFYTAVMMTKMNILVKEGMATKKRHG